MKLFCALQWQPKNATALICKFHLDFLFNNSKISSYGSPFFVGHSHIGFFLPLQKITAAIGVVEGF